MIDPRPIAVFDSGVGGLTVLRELTALLPQESFCYLGDTARLPYGTKSAEAVIHYSLRAARFLDTTFSPKAIVVACNTASSVALIALRDHFPDLPIIGVIEPTAQAAADAGNFKNLLLLATEGTIQAGTFQKHLRDRLPHAQITCQAAPVLVTMAEEGWREGSLVQDCIRTYIASAVAISNATAPPASRHFDAVILGCTHFPVMKKAFHKVLGENTTVIDSAHPTAVHVRDLLDRQGQRAPIACEPHIQLCATDSTERFARVADYFLTQKTDPRRVARVDL